MRRAAATASFPPALRPLPPTVAREPAAWGCVGLRGCGSGLRRAVGPGVGLQGCMGLRGAAWLRCRAAVQGCGGP